MNLYACVYIADYGIEEERRLQACGLPTFRIPTCRAAPNLGSRQNSFRVLVRAARMDVAEYATLYDRLTVVGLQPINTPDLFTLHCNFKKHYSLLAGYSPKAASFSKPFDTMQIFADLARQNFKYPLFVRSEMESAAKYVSIGGCTMQAPTTTQLQRCIANLENHVAKYNELIVKELVALKTTDAGKSLEYRAIVIDGRIVSFDYDVTSLPPPAVVNLASKVDTMVREVSARGLRGAYFLDVALTTGDGVLIVECKDILNGSIRDIEAFARGLLSVDQNL